MAKSKHKANSSTKTQESQQRDPSPCPCTRVPVKPESPQELPPKRPSKLRSVVKIFATLKKLIPKRLMKAKPKGTIPSGPETQSLMPETPPPIIRVPISSARLRVLPQELLLEIAKYADPVSTACLRGTSHYFRDIVPPQPLKACAKALVIARFECDMEVLPQNVICMLCKRTRPRKYFCPTTHEAWKLCSKHDRCLGLLNRKPYSRFCADHVYRHINYQPWDMLRDRKMKEEDFGVQRMGKKCNHCSCEYSYAPYGCVCGCDFCELVWQPLFAQCMSWDTKGDDWSTKNNVLNTRRHD